MSTDSAPTTASRDDFERRLRAFALREGMTFATLIGGTDADRAVIVATMSAAFDEDAVYSEREVSDRLQSWLDGAGANVETDRVTLRRWLVDTRVLSRNDDCTDYRLASPVDRSLRTIARSIDCARIADDARRERASQRVARKDAWMQRAAPAGPRPDSAPSPD